MSPLEVPTITRPSVLTAVASANRCPGSVPRFWIPDPAVQRNAREPFVDAFPTTI
jgi:hypothetical protein